MVDLVDWVSSCPVDLWNSALAMGATNLTTFSKSRSLESSIMQQVRTETGCACPHTGREQYLSPADAILATLPHVGNKVRHCTAQGTVHISTSDKTLISIQTIQSWANQPNRKSSQLDNPTTHQPSFAHSLLCWQRLRREDRLFIRTFGSILMD